MLTDVPEFVAIGSVEELALRIGFEGARLQARRTPGK
jgi:hypothetical protein